MSNNTGFENQLTNEIVLDPGVYEESFREYDEKNSLNNLDAPTRSANLVSYEQPSTSEVNTRHMFNNNSGEQHFGGDLSLPPGCILTSTNNAVDNINEYYFIQSNVLPDQTSCKSDVS